MTTGQYLMADCLPLAACSWSWYRRLDLGACRWQQVALGLRQQEGRRQLIEGFVDLLHRIVAAILLTDRARTVLPDPGIILAMIASDLAWIDPQSLIVELHRAQAEVERQPLHLVADENKHEVVLGVEQIVKGL